jgi:hypothetical protein
MLRLRRPISWLPGNTAGRFVFEIVTITTGILIALWIDGIKEDRKDWTLVRSAREQLAREIADNRQDVAQTAPSKSAPLGLNTPSFPAPRGTRRHAPEREFFLVTQRPPGFDSGGANLETARAQAFALLGAFENYRSLVAQLARAYETASKL